MFGYDAVLSDCFDMVNSWRREIGQPLAAIGERVSGIRDRGPVVGESSI